MDRRKKLLRAFGSFAFALAFPVLVAAQKLDLERITPVPATEPIPVLDFFRQPLLQQVQLNLSGTHVAAVVAAGEDDSIMMVLDLKTQTMETVGARDYNVISAVRWLDDRRFIYFVSTRSGRGFGLYAGEIGRLRDTNPVLQYIGSSVIAIPPKDRTHPLVRLDENGPSTGKYAEAVTVDTTGVGNNDRHIANRYPILKTGEGFNTGFLADKDGQLAFGFTSEKGVSALHRLVGENWEKCPVDLEEMQVIGSGDQPGEIVVLGPRHDGKPRALEFMDAATGKPGEVLLEDAAYDFNGWLYRDPVSQNIVGAIFDRSGPTVVWFSEAYRGLQKAVDRLFPGEVVRILGTDEAGKIILLSTFSDRHPPVYSWADLEKHTAGPIRNSAPWIDPKRMQSMNVMKFKTRDGRKLDAYVTLPVGASKQNPPPLVVLPRNQPEDRNTWGFDAEVQFLASRGYAVLQPNYRGSYGYSWMFPKEDEWAFRKMHDDVTDATKTLIASGLVDAHRVAIVGTSFGGYLALSGAAYEPGLYRCAASISGAVDWGKELQENKYDQFSSPWYARARLKLGDPKTELEKFDAIAPLRHAEQVQAAVFISTSEYDPSYRTSEAKEFISILERNHVPTETLSFADEAGGVRRVADKVELYSRLEVFLAKYLSPTVHASVPAGTP